MVSRKDGFGRESRRFDLQARLKAKSNYITKKIGSYWIIWQQDEDE
jgi:hypothetical protein